MNFLASFMSSFNQVNPFFFYGMLAYSAAAVLCGMIAARYKDTSGVIVTIPSFTMSIGACAWLLFGQNILAVPVIVIVAVLSTVCGLCFTERYSSFALSGKPKWQQFLLGRTGSYVALFALVLLVNVLRNYSFIVIPDAVSNHSYFVFYSVFNALWFGFLVGRIAAFFKQEVAAVVHSARR
jgi:ABC-type proline/glycine betaine transport system permease subunit